MLSCHIQRMPRIFFANADSDFSQATVFGTLVSSFPLFCPLLTQLSQFNRSQQPPSLIQANGLNRAQSESVADRVTVSLHRMTEHPVVPRSAHRHAHLHSGIRLATQWIVFTLEAADTGGRNSLPQQRGRTPISFDSFYRLSVRNQRTLPPLSHHHAVWCGLFDTSSLSTRMSSHIGAALIGVNAVAQFSPGLTQPMRTGSALRNSVRSAALNASIARTTTAQACVRACLAFYSHSTICTCAHG